VYDGPAATSLFFATRNIIENSNDPSQQHQCG
jgi:hypothetical protein